MVVRLDNNLINILLRAEIDPKAVSNIYKQIEDISKNAKPIKINIDIDGNALQAIENINKSIAKSNVFMTPKIDTSQLEKGVQSITQHFKNGEKEASSMTRTTVAGFEKTIEVLKKVDGVYSDISKKDITYNYEKERKSIEAVANAREKSATRVRAENEKLEQAQTKAINKAIEDNYKLQQAEEQRFKKLEINVDNFKQRMLGVGGFQGEMDIFADKQKGKYSENLFSQLKDDIVNFNAQSPNAEQNLKQLQIQWNLLKQSATESGNVFARALENSFKFLRYYLVGGMITSVVGELRQGVQGIKELDSSLVSLAKVADLSSQQLADVTDKAYELGNMVARTGKEVIDATALFSRMGFGVNESLKLAEEALLMVNVGDNVDNVENAADSIIAALKGFKVSAEDSVIVAKKINDMYNQVSNNFAISTGDLANGVKRSSAVLNQAGVSMEENIGLLTGAFEVLQNMERSSVGISTISQRLLGMDDDNNAIDGLSAKLEKEFNTLGLTLMDANGQIKDTYSILRSLAEVYPTLTKNQRLYIGELVSGKNRAPVLQAILSNWENVEKATEAAKNSANSAIIENERYMDSIEGKSKQLSSSTEMFFKNLIDPELIKTSIASLNSLVQALDNLINNPMSKFIIQVGIISTVVALARKGFIALNNSMVANTLGTIALNIAQNGLIATTQTLTATMMASPLFAIVAGTTVIMAIVKAVDLLTVSLKEQKEIVETLSADIQSLQSEYDKLKGTENRTDEQNMYLNLLQQELNNKKELLKIETERAIQQEFFKRTGSKKDGYENMDSGSDQIKNSIDELIKLQEKLSQATNKQDYDKINEKILKIKLSLTDSLKTIKDYINIMGEDAPKALQELASSIESIVINQNELSNATEDADEELYKEQKTLEDLTKKFEDITSKIQTYNVFLSEMATKEGLSAKSKQEIIAKHQQLLPYLDDEKLLRQQLIQIIAEEEKAQRQAYVNMIMLNEDFFNAKIKGNNILVEKLGEYYNKDLENAKSLAKAKELVENELIKNLSGKWAKYYNILTTSNNQAMVDSLARGAMQGSKEAAEVLKAVQAYKDVENRFNNIALEVGNVSFKDINMANVKDDKKKKSKEEYKAEADRYQQINLQLDRNNILLQKNKTLQDLAGDELSKKIPLMEEEIRLNKERQKSLHELNKEQRQEVKELENILSKQGFKFVGDGDKRMIANFDHIKGKTKEVEEQFNRYIQLQKTEIPKVSQDWWGLKNTIDKTGQSIEDLTKKSVRDLLEAEKRNLYLDLERRQRVANERLKALKEEMDNEVEYYQKKIDNLQQEINDIQEEEKYRAEQKERIKRLDEISKLQDKYYALQFENLSDLSEEQAKAIGLEKERTQYLERQARIQELLLKLENVRRQKNIQQLTKQSDGTWQFEYVADQKEIDNITKDITKLQEEHSTYIKDLKESTLADLRQKQEDYDEWERQNEIQREIERKRRRIERYQDEIKDLEDNYRQKEQKTREAFEIERENLDRHYMDMDILTDERMKQLYETFDNNWTEIHLNLKSHFDQIQDEYLKLVEVMSQPLPNPSKAAKPTSSGSVSGGSSSSSSRDRDRGSFDKQVERMKEHADYDRENSREIERISREHDVDSSIAREMDKTNKREGKKVYRDGGETQLTGLHWLDGVKGKPERVLSAQQTKDFNKLVEQMPNLLKAFESKNFLPNMQNLTSSIMSSISIPNIPKIASANGSSGEIKQQIDVQMNFPNVKDAKEIEKSVLTLSTYAKQWANRK
ncbi:phage tail tape measure protein [Tissierella praeacuta]|uniref:phage tail tape measure protein n=1 Tax=Tissierella praeacuta TaxID=43131 RepID=UPI003DA642F6